MNYAALRTELLSGPLAAGLAPLLAAGDHTAAAAVMNDPGRGYARPRDLPIGEFVGFATASGLIDRAEAAAADAGSPDPVRAGCRKVVRVYSNPHLTVLYAADVTATAGGLHAAGLLSDAERDALLGMLAVPCGRAELALGRAVTYLDIGAALAAAPEG